MNYLERLIRRALLEAPQAGEALRDPFTNEAPLELETPVSVPASKEARPMAPLEVPGPQVRVEQTTQIITQHDVSHHETREIAASPVQESIVPEPPAVTMSAVPESVPLAQADAFMRELGVEVTPHETPATKFSRAEIRPSKVETPRRIELPVPVPAPGPAPISHEPPAKVSPASIAPPPAPRRELVPVRAASEQTGSDRPDGSTRRRPAEKKSTPRPVREVIRERIHVVKVVHDSGAHSAANAGAAPATFGAAQL